MKSFHELSLSAPLIRALDELKFETPTPIQAEALPLLLAGETDFVGLAATGTGKTATFSIPLLEKLDTQQKGVQALILCPTRELALQVSGQISLLGKYRGVRTVAIYGGSSFNEQVRGLRNGASIVIGTPGRILDHIRRATLKLDGVRTVVLDEADEMISMGFKEDLQAILENTSQGSHKWLFTATMDRDVARVADTYLRDPQRVQVNRTEMLSSTVQQVFYATRDANKPEVLCKIIDAADEFYGLIFCQTKDLVSHLSHYLMDHGYKVDSLHGDKDQNARERTMQAFRDRRVTMLVCTDVASRGLDVKDVTHVINYSIPRELDSYVHRIGRTARSGKSGIAISLVSPSHRGLIPRIEKMTKSKIREGILPTRKDLGIKKVSKLLPRFQDASQFSKAVELMGSGWRDAISSMTSEEVAARFLMMTFPHLFVEQEREREKLKFGVRAVEAQPRNGQRSHHNKHHQNKHNSSKRRSPWGERSSRKQSHQGRQWHRK